MRKAIVPALAVWTLVCVVLMCEPQPGLLVRWLAPDAAKFSRLRASGPRFPDKFGLLDHSLRQVDHRLGMLCEFGVWKGETINYIAQRVYGRPVHGFDSFEGLPGPWQGGLPPGTFALPSLPAVRPNVILHKGWFAAVLPGFAREHREALAFAHLDADIYSSTKTVFDALADRIVAGTILQFDEYFNYPGWREEEYRAWQEFAAAHDVRYEYIGYAEQQMAVKVLTVQRRRP